MPTIAAWHPQVVHFVVALAFIGVGARIVSLLPLGFRFKFASPMATSLIVMAAIGSFFAVKSGTDAHGPVERVPGARQAVVEHEDAGKLARSALACLALLELVALALATRPKLGKALQVAAAAGGLVTLGAVYEAAEHGGELVYNYAGGVGLRSGDTTDTRRLLIAGLYHQAMAERTAGRPEAAARLIEELVRQMPDDTTVKFLGAESQLRDQKNPRAALSALSTMDVPATDLRLQTRKSMLTADAYAAAGVPDSARLVLEALKAKLPEGPGRVRVQQAIDKL